eukprot:356295-Chlamydomonas_euryale.AAC.10
MRRGGGSMSMGAWLRGKCSLNTVRSLGFSGFSEVWLRSRLPISASKQLLGAVPRLGLVYCFWSSATGLLVPIHIAATSNTSFYTACVRIAATVMWYLAGALMQLSNGSCAVCVGRLYHQEVVSLFWGGAGEAGCVSLRERALSVSCP